MIEPLSTWERLTDIEGMFPIGNNPCGYWKKLA